MDYEDMYSEQNAVKDTEFYLSRILKCQRKTVHLLRFSALLLFILVILKCIMG